MDKKNTPILSMVLYVLSVLNILVMIVCLLTAVNADGTIRSNAFFAQALLGTMADVFLGYLSQAIRGIAFLFMLINAGISVMLFTAARLVKSSSSLSFRVQQLETRLDISPVN